MNKLAEWTEFAEKLSNRLKFWSWLSRYHYIHEISFCFEENSIIVQPPGSNSTRTAAQNRIPHDLIFPPEYYNCKLTNSSTNDWKKHEWTNLYHFQPSWYSDANVTSAIRLFDEQVVYKDKSAHTLENVHSNQVTMDLIHVKNSSLLSWRRLRKTIFVVPMCYWFVLQNYTMILWSCLIFFCDTNLQLTL